jgi:hypothetical protein
MVSSGQTRHAYLDVFLVEPDCPFDCENCIVVLFAQCEGAARIGTRYQFDRESSAW